MNKNEVENKARKTRPIKCSIQKALNKLYFKKDKTTFYLKIAVTAQKHLPKF